MSTFLIAWLAVGVIVGLVVGALQIASVPPEERNWQLLVFSAERMLGAALIWPLSLFSLFAIHRDEED